MAITASSQLMTKTITTPYSNRQATMTRMTRHRERKELPQNLSNVLNFRPSKGVKGKTMKKPARKLIFLKKSDSRSKRERERRKMVKQRNRGKLIPSKVQTSHFCFLQSQSVLLFQAYWHHIISFAGRAGQGVCTCAVIWKAKEEESRWICMLIC